eukprot:scaffold12635_cov183-Skeletonema_menzelii.AAC.3
MEDVGSGKWIPREDIKPSALEDLLIDDEILAKGEGGGIPSDLYSTDKNGNKQLNMKQWCIEYTRRLEASGKFQLMIWPEHCLVGTEGHNYVTSISDAMMEWSRKTGGSVEWVNKGQNLLTENYSALCAEVPVTKKTSFDYQLLESLKTSEKLIMCGEAMSHCVNYTVRDIADHWPKEEMGKLVVLKDCASTIPGFEDASNKFLSDMAAAGVNVETTETLKL